jgi:hypothetical protein
MSVSSKLVAASIISLLAPVAAQTPAFELGGQLVVVGSGEFDDTDIGIGGRAAWRPRGLFGVESELTVYPTSFPGSRVAFSQGRVESLTGVTVGPRIGRLRLFGKARAGFLRYENAGPVVCIAIFPPPLSCQLAGGRTLFAADLGGGIEFDYLRRMVFRVEGGDRLLDYPEPRGVGHDVRIGAGVAFRF